MKARSVDAQIAALRPGLGFAAHVHNWLLAGAAIGVIAAVFFWHPVPLMIAAFLGVVGLSERKAGPNLVAAVAAYDSGTPAIGEVSVAITCWSDSDHYHATVHGQGGPDWEYEFMPQGWRPAAGRYPARIWRAAADGEPILAVVEEGILIPRYPPRPRSGSVDAAA